MLCIKALCTRVHGYLVDEGDEVSAALVMWKHSRWHVTFTVTGTSTQRKDNPRTYNSLNKTPQQNRQLHSTNRPVHSGGVTRL